MKEVDKDKSAEVFVEANNKPVSDEDKKKLDRLSNLLNKLEYSEAKKVESEDFTLKGGVLPVPLFTALKYKLFKKKNYAWVLKCYRSGSNKLLFLKNPKVISFGKKRDALAPKTEITKIYHYLGGQPLHICVEGIPINVSLNKEIKIAELSPHINGAVIHAHQIGVLRGMKAAIKGAFSNPLFLIALVAMIIAAGAAAYFSYQASEATTTSVYLLQRLIDLNASIVAGA